MTELSAGERLDNLSAAVEGWLQPGNKNLKRAIERTVDERLFSFPDVKYQIRVLKKTVHKKSLAAWLEKSAAELSKSDGGGEKILCLHAGNLPLVGLQDLLACCLAGKRYIGKLSRKDPYLMQSLLDKLNEAGLAETYSWSVQLENLRDCRADAVLFAGSGRSVELVQKKIDDLNLASEKAQYLIRTAHYSLAYIESMKQSTMEALTEAVFRFGGRGCRSVAVVIAPAGLDSAGCNVTDYVESFWLKNPQHLKPAPSLFHRFAYNKAVGHNQSWLDDFLIEETEMKPEEDFVLHWIPGGEEKLTEFVRRHGSGLQTVYTEDSNRQITGLDMETEPLDAAHRPSVWWKPDGTDPLHWLLTRKFS